MSTKEEKLREHILSRYKSVREFAMDNGIPYTTVKSALSRGLDNSSICTVLCICNALGISADALATGEIRTQPPPRATGSVDIKDVMLEAWQKLQDSTEVTLDGQKMDAQEVDYIIEGLDVVLEVAKRRKKP